MAPLGHKQKDQHTTGKSDDMAVPACTKRKEEKWVISSRLAFTDMAEVYTPPLDPPAVSGTPSLSAVQPPSISFTRHSFADEEELEEQWRMPVLPKFSPLYPEEWFAFAEERFGEQGITNWQAKFDLLVDSLPLIIYHQVQRTILGPPWQPGHGDIYNILKMRLIRKYGSRKMHIYNSRPSFQSRWGLTVTSKRANY